MTSNRTHICVYFDDGGPDHVCVCGSSALLVLDERGAGGRLMALLDESAPVASPVTAPRVGARSAARDGEFAVSA